MPAYNSRREQLRGLAQRLGADVPPYYRHSPAGEAEPAPGWYWRPAGADHPRYLGHNFLTAYVALSKLVDRGGQQA